MALFYVIETCISNNAPSNFVSKLYGFENTLKLFVCHSKSIKLNINRKFDLNHPSFLSKNAKKPQMLPLLKRIPQGDCGVLDGLFISQDLETSK